MVEESFDIVQLDTKTGKATIEKADTYQASSLLEAYQHFLAFLTGKQYFKAASSAVKPKTGRFEYLLVGQQKPLVTSDTINCVLFPNTMAA